MYHWKPDRADQRPAPAGLLGPDLLAELLVMEIRHHPHFNNVLTHVCDGNWGLVERTLLRLLDVQDLAPLSALQARVLALLCGERGVTGKLMKPWIDGLLRRFGAEASEIQETWLQWHQWQMAQPCRVRVSAMRAIKRRG